MPTCFGRWQPLSEKIGVSGCQLFDKVGCRQGGFAFAYHWNAVFFGEVFRVDVVAAVHEHLFDVDLLLWRIFHRVVPLERAAIDGESVLFLEATKQLGTMLNSCSSSLKNL